jgi:hypothetical protein
MSRIRIVIAVGLIAVGIGLAPWGRAAEPTPAKPVAPAETERERALKQLLADRAEEIDKLKLENERLKQEVRDLKSRRPAVLPQLPPLKLAPPSPAVPKNAVPREFNGETYYLVPLNETLELKAGTQGYGTVQLRGENQTPLPASNLPATKTGR